MPPTTGTWLLASEPFAASKARALLVAFQQASEPDATPSTVQRQLADVLVLTSEVVTNAVRHGSGLVRMRAEQSEHGLRVSVHDHGTAMPQLREPDPLALGGRGLLLVEAMASAWGVTRHPDDGKTVWFESEIPR